MPQPEPKSKQPEVAGPATEIEASARLEAERAITEFKSQSLEATVEKVREAFAHLMIGRGFKRAKQAPVMTIHTAMLAGAESAEADKAAEAKTVTGKAVPPTGAGNDVQTNQEKSHEK